MLPSTITSIVMETKKYRYTVIYYNIFLLFRYIGILVAMTTNRKNGNTDEQYKVFYISITLIATQKQLLS